MREIEVNTLDEMCDLMCGDTNNALNVVDNKIMKYQELHMEHTGFYKDLMEIREAIMEEWRQ